MASMAREEDHRFRVEIVTTTDGIVPQFYWEVQKFSFGKWHRVRSGVCSSRPLAETRSGHVLEEEQERAAREELLA